jgi:hypothetical protein
MAQLFDLVIATQVAGRRCVRGIGPATDDDAVLSLRHLGYVGTCLFAERLAGHATGNRHHHVDRQIRVSFDGRVGVDLQLGKGPPLVEDAQTDLAVAFDDAGLAAAGHCGYQEFVAVGGDVVDD